MPGAMNAWPIGWIHEKNLEAARKKSESCVMRSRLVAGHGGDEQEVSR
jgi:hypothetical protein